MLLWLPIQFLLRIDAKWSSDSLGSSCGRDRVMRLSRGGRMDCLCIICICDSAMAIAGATVKWASYVYLLPALLSRKVVSMAFFAADV